MATFNETCSVCGASLVSDAAFCPYCGTAVNKAASWEKTIFEGSYGDTGDKTYVQTTNATYCEEIRIETPERPAYNPFQKADPSSYQPPVRQKPQQADTDLFRKAEPQPFQQPGAANPFQSAAGAAPQPAPQPKKKEKTPRQKKAQPVTAESGPLTAVQFYRQFASKKSKNLIKVLMIICFVMALASFGGAVNGQNPNGIIHVAGFAVLGVLLLKIKQWYIPLAAAIYTVVGGLIFGLTGGAALMIIIGVLGVLGMLATKKVNRAYNTYQTTGQFPDSAI